MQIPDYAELHCLSCFSFMRGASHPEELAATAAALGYRALAITDECSLAGVVRAHREIRNRQLPLHLIIGSELRVHDGPTLILLARSRRGYAQLSRLISSARRAAAKGTYSLGRDAFTADAVDDCLALLLPPDDYSAGLAQAHWLAGRFPSRCWLAAPTHGPRLASRHHQLATLAAASALPVAAASGVLMHDASRREVADTLCAIRLRTPLAQCGYALAANGERRLHTRAELGRRVPAAWLAETLKVAAACTFTLDELRYEYPAGLVPAGETAARWLRRLVEGGLQWRYHTPAGAVFPPPPGPPGRPPPCADPAPPPVRTLIEDELALISELGYEPYFLTVYDIVAFARAAGILCQGRGSAANSAVCWALGITEVHPEQGIMLFERFISRERQEPPDIDVDFEHERREEVIQYLYRKYGREHAALAAAVITWRTRSALRDVGRALGIDAARIERLCAERISIDDGHVDAGRLHAAGLDPQSPLVCRWLALSATLRGFPRHLSQHVGGFVIARGRIDELVPVENAAMDGRTVIQWDKDDLDTMGLLKVDVLALGMLSALRRCLDLLGRQQARRLTLADIPREDAAVYRMLSAADAIGVFQVESRAQLGMLPRLQPAQFYDLVVEVAIVRPGPIQGGMVHPYLHARASRRRGEDPLAGVRTEVRAVLSRTLGVPIFQEQVMQLAVVAAGFSPGEADQLRRAMGAWRRPGELERYRRQLLDGMAARGYDAGFAERLCRQIEGFGSYGFPESHAASFALLVYFSAWFKCHHPALFLCALLNSQPMGFYAPAQLIQDARRHGVEARPADVCHSDWESTLETPTTVRLGLGLLRGGSAAGGGGRGGGGGGGARGGGGGGGGPARRGGGRPALPPSATPTGSARCKPPPRCVSALAWGGVPAPRPRRASLRRAPRPPLLTWTTWAAAPALNAASCRPSPPAEHWQHWPAGAVRRSGRRPAHSRRRRCWPPPGSRKRPLPCRQPARPKRFSATTASRASPSAATPSPCCARACRHSASFPPAPLPRPPTVRWPAPPAWSPAASAPAPPGARCSSPSKTRPG